DVPVVVELRRDAVLLETGAQPTPEVMELLVAKGARARLQLESLVTARQYVGIDFFPNREPRRVAGPVDLSQIPSVRSPIAANLDRLSGDLRAALDARNTQAARLLGELGDTTVAVRRLSEQAGQLLAENRTSLKDFSDRGLPELAGLIEDATRTVNELDGTL